MKFADEIKNTTEQVLTEKKKVANETLKKEKADQLKQIENMKKGRFSEKSILDQIRESAKEGRKRCWIEIYSEENYVRAVWREEIIDWITKLLLLNGFQENQIKTDYREQRYSDDSPLYDVCNLIVEW